MLSIETLSLIEAIFNSDTLAVKGSQLNMIYGVLQQIAQEKQRLMIASRLTPSAPNEVPDPTTDTIKG